MEVKKRKEPLKDIPLSGYHGTIFLTIKIGNAQIGGSILQFEDEEDPLGKGKIKNFPLGKPLKLKGRTLSIETNVLDSNTATNKIVIRHIFQTEEEEIATFVVEDEVEHHKDIFSCDAFYRFNP